jgi:hypothetical protein
MLKNLLMLIFQPAFMKGWMDEMKELCNDMGKS